MKHTQKSNIALLKNRLHRDYEDYRDEAIEYGGEYAFVLAAEVVAVKEVYNYLTGDNFIDEDDAAFLLKFENPLKALADEWEKHKLIENDDFDEFICGFIANGNTEQHMTVSIADELRGKYGEDIPLNTACLLELVAIGRKLFSMIEADCFNACDFEEFTFDYAEDEDDDYEFDEFFTKGGGF